MGSTGKSGTGVVSSVDTRHTPMSAEDIKQVSGDWSTGYFQTANAFDINHILRTVEENGTSLKQELEDFYGGIRAANVQKTIDAMDRNMRPIDKDMKVIRMAGRNYADTLFKSLGVDSSVLAKLSNLGMSRIDDATLQSLKDAAIGAKVTEAGYMSATYNTSLTDSAFKSRPVKLEFDAKAGTKGMFSPTNRESEFVFARSTPYEITDIRWDSSKHKLVISVRT